MEWCLSWNRVFVALAVGRQVGGRRKIVKWILYSNLGLTEVFQTLQRNVSPSQEGLLQLLSNLKAVSQAHLRLLLFYHGLHPCVVLLVFFSYLEGVSRSVVTLIFSCTELPEEYSAPRVQKAVCGTWELYFIIVVYCTIFLLCKICCT